MNNYLTVSSVRSGSIASEMEIEPGDRILHINGSFIDDILDFQYQIADEQFTVFIQKINGEIWELDIEKEPGEDLGIELGQVSAQGLKRCRNNCVFCFVRQMPQGLRKSLYDKDDDYRLSVTQGSYITLSNLTEKDFLRILRLHISPLYLSVHAWNPAARKKLMKNSRAALLPEQIQRLVEGRITLHTQIVLVPGYNDGEILWDTVNHLAELYPSVQSVGVVPVGLTKFREGLPLLRTVTRKEAEMILEEGTKLQETLRQRTGKSLVYFSDEFYVLAGKKFPDRKLYDDFPQIENGIGMASKFQSELAKLWSQIPPKIAGKRIHLITGVSAASFFRSLAADLSFVQGLELIVHEIKNVFFGETVTVAGLLTAGDIAGQVGNIEGEEFLVPRVMLKADCHLFLDDYDIKWLERKINGKAVIVENKGLSFLQAIFGRDFGGADNE
ncbi:radical SAM protein [Syntrophobotulus glycolicus]|nr:radical SAM protein [Syntrophobotulus glycolicus]